ncbi:MAG: hypothetical protein AB1726_11475, partial [Planctomycetota bacterium]
MGEPAGTESPRGEPVPAPRPPRRSELWSSPELAWPLALFAGFAGTLLGVAVPLPGAAAAFATAAFAPLYLRLQARGRAGT